MSSVRSVDVTPCSVTEPPPQALRSMTVAVSSTSVVAASSSTAVIAACSSAQVIVPPRLARSITSPSVVLKSVIVSSPWPS